MAFGFHPRDLQTYNTLGLSAQGRMGVLASEDDLHHLQEILPTVPGRSLYVLGGGSNVVMSTQPQSDIVHVALRGCHLIAETGQAYLIEAAAGENWHEFVSWTLQQGWPGLENLALIPGTVGAAPVQNIGAYGLELSERLHSLDALQLASGQIITLYPADCHFGYRDSRFKRDGAGQWLILKVRFALPKAWQARLSYPDLQVYFKDTLACRRTPSPQQIFEAVCEIRHHKLPDPSLLANAGSFFKNPVISPLEAAALQTRFDGLRAYPQADGSVKLAAGWLIEQAGWKGKRQGPVGMHARQALVLVNYGGATAQDVWALAGAVQASVQTQFGIALEAEPLALE